MYGFLATKSILSDSHSRVSQSSPGQQDAHVHSKQREQWGGGRRRAEMCERTPHSENGQTTCGAVAETRVGQGPTRDAMWWSLASHPHVGQWGEGTLEHFRERF